MKFFLWVLLILFLVYHLFNKVIWPNYCDRFSWEELNYSEKLNKELRECQDTFVCKVWENNNYEFNWYEMRKWKCIPKVWELKLWEFLEKRD